MTTRSPISRLYDAGIGFDGSPLPGRELGHAQEQAVAVRRSSQLRWLSVASVIIFVVAMYLVFRT